MMIKDLNFSWTKQFIYDYHSAEYIISCSNEMFWLWLWLWFQNFDSFTCGTPGSEKKPSAGD